MAILVRASVAWAVVTANSVVTLPTHAAGDRIYVFATWKAFGTTASIAGWTEVTEFADGAVAAAANVGSVKVGAWYLNATSSAMSNPTLAWSVAPAPGAYCAITLQPTAGETWDAPLFATAAIAAAINWTATASSTMTVKDGAIILELAGFRDDSSTMTRSATTALEDDGTPNVTWNGNVVENPGHASSTTSNDIAADLIHRFVTTGAAGVNLTATGTLLAAETGACLWVHQGVSSDTTAPILTSQTVDTITTVGGVPKVTTDEGNGTAYMVVVPNGDSPSVAQIKAGQNSSGGAALANQSQAVPGTGVQTFTAVTGLSSNTAYDAWFVHTDAAANNSTAVKADFTTAAGFADIRQDIIDGLDSAESEAAGWDAKRSLIPVTAVVRTSDTVVTITLPALSGYDITAPETITGIVPASALVTGGPLLATPTFTISPVLTGSFTVTVPVGTLSLAGPVPTVLFGAAVVITPPVGTLRIQAPWTADTDKFTADSSVITADNGAGTNQPTVLVNYIVQPGFGELTVIGFAPTLGLPRTVVTGLGQATLAGFAATIGLPKTVSPALGQPVLTGFAPTVPTTIKPGLGQLTVSGFAPSVSFVAGSPNVSPGTGLVTATGFAPTLGLPRTLVFGFGQLALTGQAPTLPINVRPGLGALVVTGFAPSVSFVTPGATVTPGTGLLTATGFAPTVGLPRTVVPATGDLVLTGHAPNIPTTVVPGFGQLVFTGYAPIVTPGPLGLFITPGTGQLVVTGYEFSVGSLAMEIDGGPVMVGSLSGGRVLVGVLD